MKKENESRKTERKHLSPIKTIRAYCLHCVGGSSQDVKDCDATDLKYHVCPFHPFRLGQGRPSVKIIRKFCLQCMGDYKDFVRDCETKDCFCHPYRMGKNPDRKGIGRSAERMKVVRAQKTGVSKNLSGKFERSPLAPAPTLSRGQIKNSSDKNAISDHRGETPEGQAPDPSPFGESRNGGRKPKTGGQIPLFPPG